MVANSTPVTLGDVVDLAVGYPFRSAHYVEHDDGVRLLRGDNVAQGQIRWDGVKRWPTSMLTGLDGYALRAGDVVLAMDRPWIEAGLKYGCISGDDLPALLVQRVARLRGTARLDTGFLRYVIGSRGFTEHVLAVQTGTAVPHISGAQIKSFRFLLPSIEEQRDIAGLLGALDKKIDLNRRMNETLEAMARAIFKDWFVDFGPTRAKMQGRPPYLAPDVWALFPNYLDDDGKPHGWCAEPLLKHARLISGGTPKTDVTRYWNGSIPWASAKDVSQCNATFLAETERTITEAGLAESATRMIPRAATVVVARGATTGRYCMFDKPMAMNQTCYGLDSLHARPFWLNSAFGGLVDGLVHAAHGSVFDTITTRTIEGARVLNAGDPLLDAFEAQVHPLFERIASNTGEVKTLATMRDLLLPKLMSGEIRINEAEKLLADVA
jgi:type I restriction enzyme S subunit